MPTRRPTQRSVLLAGGLMASGVYSWVVAGLRPFTGPMNLAVALPVLLLLLVVVRWWGQPGAGPDPDPEHAHARRIAGAVWIGLVALLTTWELVAFFSLPRRDHPTLSSIADDVMSTHPGRALMFALWLTLGWLLFARAPKERR